MVDLNKKLDQQLKLIKSSCRIYDEDGLTDQALHIAVSLRVLFHDTKMSTSLLKHLGKKEEVKLISTFVSQESTSIILGGDNWHTVLPLMLTSKGVNPPKDEWDIVSALNFDDWWNEVIWAETGFYLSRKDIVLQTVNKDGGGHIETELPSKLRKMHSGPKILSIKINGVEQKGIFENQHHPLIRQIAYEVLNSPSLNEIKADRSD